MKREYDLRKILAGPPRMTLAVAESMTCGCVQARVGAISGASEFFLGGLTAYTIDLKTRLLGVDRAEAEAANSASARVAEEMARGVCLLLGSTAGVATTGYAEPLRAELLAFVKAIRGDSPPPVTGDEELARFLPQKVVQAVRAKLPRAPMP